VDKKGGPLYPFHATTHPSWPPQPQTPNALQPPYYACCRPGEEAGKGLFSFTFESLVQGMLPSHPDKNSQTRPPPFPLYSIKKQFPVLPFSLSILPCSREKEECAGKLFGDRASRTDPPPKWSNQRDHRQINHHPLPTFGASSSPSPYLPLPSQSQSGEWEGEWNRGGKRSNQTWRRTSEQSERKTPWALGEVLGMTEHLISLRIRYSGLPPTLFSSLPIPLRQTHFSNTIPISVLCPSSHPENRE